MTARVRCVGSCESRPLRRLLDGLITLVLAVMLLSSAAPDAVQASVAMPKNLIRIDRPEIEDPDMLVDRYLEAVDKGELKIFNQMLTRSMIVPARVEYVYELLSRTTQIVVYSNLKEPLPVPGQPECQILGVSAAMEDGHITEIKSHIWLKPRAQPD